MKQFIMVELSWEIDTGIHWYSSCWFMFSKMNDVWSFFLAIAIVYRFSTAEQCTRFRHKLNVNVSCDDGIRRNFTQTVRNVVCMEQCEENNCTAVVTETKLNTTWCCLFTKDNVTYHRGNNVLFYYQTTRISTAAHGKLVQNISSDWSKTGCKMY